MSAPRVPDPKKLSAVEAMCTSPAPYPQESNGPLFLEAMRQAIGWHVDNCAFYGAMNPILPLTEKDLERVPMVPANFFKRREVLSIPREKVFLHLTSSGTTGQKSQIFFDEWTIRSAQAMVDRIFEFYGWVTPETPVNYLLYSYEPEEGSKLGTAYTDNFLCKYAPVNGVTYALKYAGKDGHKFDAFGVIEALKRYENLPVRIFGFPAFLYFTLEKMKELGVPPLKLHPDSMTFLGGGWKGHQGKAITKHELYALAGEMLGIPDERMRDGFGSVEHCVPYVECSKHEFHIPAWSRVLIRGVRTLEALPAGETGYLNFISPYITSVPAVSVLMGDLATRHEAHECSCGTPAPFFRIVGRAGLTSNKSCAVAAAEILSQW